MRVRMAFQTRSPQKNVPSVPPSFTRTFLLLYHEGTAVSPSHLLIDRFPLLKFYRGFTVTVAGMIPYAGVSFLSWDFLRAKYLHPDRTKPTPVADLAIGAISGAVAQTVSYPFEVVRRRMQVGGLTSPDRWLRWGETVSAVWRVGGWRGFYVGLGIGYLKVVPMTAVSFAVWQSMKRLLEV
jgi:solute carrier family 25 (mitochondrial carrier protein), member 16